MFGNDFVFSVYDTYHPVVGHTNLLTVGLTGALAWALPSKLAYPDDYFNEMYKHENMSLLRRNGNDVEVNSIRNENVNGKAVNVWINWHTIEC